MPATSSSKQPFCLIIGGPTGSGKTATAVLLARQLNGEIINCDSMQIYRGLDIGTAKATAEEQAEVKHHLIDILPPADSFSVADYVQLAEETAKEISNRGKLAIFCGGTGQYISALMKGYSYRNMPYDESLRKSLWQAAENPEAYEELLAELRSVDPSSYASIPAENKKRIIRALEIYRLTGETVTAQNEKSRLERPGLSCRLFIISHERAVLYERINRRVDAMLEQGLLEEARSLLKLDLPATATCLQAIGYKELFPYFAGEKNLPEVVADLKQASRRYAKRQLTWFRNQLQGDWIMDCSPERAAEVIISLLGEPTCYLA